MNGFTINKSTIQRLLRRAIQAREMAYAPYSKFKVGAALRTVDGYTFTGCNVENASYGLTICAERVAVATAVAGGHRSIYIVALVGDDTTMPCGACLQTLAEFCVPDAIIFTAPVGNPDDYKFFRLKELLPHAFQLQAFK